MSLRTLALNSVAFIVVTLGALPLFSDVTGGVCTEQTLLESSDDFPRAFGNSIAFKGNTMIVTDSLEPDSVPQAGAAYVFEYDEEDGTWTEIQRLTASDQAVDNNRFGNHVSIHEDVAAVLGHSGIYVFNYDEVTESWIEVQKIVDTTGDSGYSLGGVYEDMILLGYPDDDGDEDRSGAVIVYTFNDIDNEWQETQKLKPEEEVASGQMGQFMYTDGNWIAATSQSSVHVFDYDEEDAQWEETHVVTPSGGGQPLRLVGDTDLLIFSSYLDDDCHLGDGAVYVCRYDDETDSWEEVQTITPARQNTVYSDLALSGDALLIGARFADVGAEDEAGRVSMYLYDADADWWEESARLVAYDALEDDNYGDTVAISPKFIAVGTNRALDGSVYVQNRTSTVVHSAPESKSLWVGESATWEVEATGDELEYSWLHEGEEVGTDVDFIITDATSDDSGQYECLVTGADGCAISSQFTVTVSDPCDGVGVRRIWSPDTSRDMNFGWAVSASGHTAVITAIEDDTDCSRAGSAHVYRYDEDLESWVYAQRIPGTGANRELFGYSADIHGDALAVGIKGALEDRVGELNVYREVDETWDLEQVLVPSDAGEDDWFAQTCSIDESSIAVGAPRYDGEFTNSGAVYVFEHDGTEWSEIQKIEPSDGEFAGAFGRAVSVGPSWLLVGAKEAAYLYERTDGDTTWEFRQKLTAPDFTNNTFGGGVALSGERAAIGARTDDEAGTNYGAIYLFELDNETGSWEHVEKLMLEEESELLALGGFVDLEDDVLIGRAQTVIDGVPNSAASVFRSTTDGWVQVAEFVGGPTSTAPHAVALSGKHFFVQADGTDEDQGAVYVAQSATPEILSITCDSTSTDNLEVLFSAEFWGTPTLEYEWDFGDGETSTEKAPTHTYSDPGTYSISLTITNDCGTAESTHEYSSAVFTRGDVDGNGEVFAIIDALFLLEWGFTNGPVPVCMKSADVDDNGDLFPIIDTLYLLNWGFVNGPIPPAPSPGDCGADLSTDELTCETSTCTP